MTPTDIIPRFDAFLHERGLTLEAVIIGGAALAFLRVVSRETRDCDVIYPDLPSAILTAAHEFAAELSAQGNKLDSDWFNNGPVALGDLLPGGWYDRIQLVFTGKALRLLRLHSLGRSDLLCRLAEGAGRQSNVARARGRCPLRSATEARPWSLNAT